MAQNDFALRTACSQGVDLEDDYFTKASGKIVPKGTLKAGAALTMSATTSTAMTTNATLFGLFVAPVAGTILSAFYTPVSAVTGADTNTFEVNLVNKASGAGTTEIVSKAYTSGVDATAYDANSLGTIASATLAAEDVVVAQYQKVGDGQDAPAGFVTIVWRPS